MVLLTYEPKIYTLIYRTLGYPVYGKQVDIRIELDTAFGTTAGAETTENRINTQMPRIARLYRQRRLGL